MAKKRRARLSGPRPEASARRLTVPKRTSPRPKGSTRGKRSQRNASEQPKPARRSKRGNVAKPKARARDAYVRTHWGEVGAWERRQSVIVDGRHGELVVLGVLERVVYATVKGGDDDIVDYDHAFESTKPLLVFHVCDRAKCKERGKVTIAGGSYRVTARGIVG